MKIAFIVQRYGTEIIGGSEYHCRLVAEHLSEKHEVEVITTCAKNYITWENEYPEGTDRIQGVTVRRFTNSQTRDIDSFNKYSDWIFSNPHTDHDEEEWLKQQGPWCPALINYLEQKHASYDALIFFTYLYAPTVLGLSVAPKRSILVPTAHDEPAIRLNIYKSVFSKPAAMAYNTTVERGFLKNNFSIIPKREEIVGCGVELSTENHLNLEKIDQAFLEKDDEDSASSMKSNPMRGSAFRRRHRLYAPIVLYGGRIDPGKGCEELIEYFNAYVNQKGDATLALMGLKLMPIPETPFIKFAGMLSETERLEALEAADVVVVPSPHESLSLLALEAFSVGTPILASARSDVLTDHCQRSNAGLYYSDCDEFVECLNLLIKDRKLSLSMGINGQNYVKNNYSWQVVLAKYERLIGGVAKKRNNRSSRSGRYQRRSNRSQTRTKQQP